MTQQETQEFIDGVERVVIHLEQQIKEKDEKIKRLEYLEVQNKINVEIINDKDEIILKLFKVFGQGKYDEISV